MRVVKARKLQAWIDVAVCRGGDLPAVSAAHGQTVAVFALAALHGTNTERRRAREYRQELPYIDVHFVRLLGIFFGEIKHFFVVFVDVKTGVTRVFFPARAFRGTDYTHFVNSHFVKHFRSRQNRFEIKTVNVGLSPCLKAVLLA